MRSRHHTRPGDHQRLPATPEEIGRVLKALGQLSRVLADEGDVPITEIAGDSGVSGCAELLAGLVLGFEGTVYPVPGDVAGDLGYRVAQSLARGGSQWL